MTVEFDQVDKSGAFIGTLYLNKKVRLSFRCEMRLIFPQNFAVMLAAEGLAKLRAYYDKLPYSHELERAVEEAKNERKGVSSTRVLLSFRRQ